MTIPENLPALLLGFVNPPDLIIIGLMLISGVMGAKRGLIRTFCNFLGRFVSMAGATLFAKLIAPTMSRYLMTPIVGQIFEVRAADWLSRMPETAANAVQTSATQIATQMAQNLAFCLLFFIFMFALNALVHMITGALKWLSRIGPISVLNRMGGFVVGAAFGLILCALGLFALKIFAPSVFTELGWLNPTRVAGSTLTAFLLGLMPNVPTIS